ncbi:MAG TPA: GIY-YIG nuclease family protein [Hellea balneolensis]|uniref:GIY-YIG nuclease family protein n=1 Tax=Hellea balneolensis TaxID=287478 RepID=A0A7C3GL69_9PROT|nr:GIY-YIG nuclease family protein [Hellea balneolensis]
MDWSVYIVQCDDGSLYTGITNDLERRVSQHNAGRGAKYTKTRRPVRLVYHEASDNRSTASQREHAIKKLSRSEKLKLISPPKA